MMAKKSKPRVKKFASGGGVFAGMGDTIEEAKRLAGNEFSEATSGFRSALDKAFTRPTTRGVAPWNPPQQALPSQAPATPALQAPAAPPKQKDTRGQGAVPDTSWGPAAASTGYQPTGGGFYTPSGDGAYQRGVDGDRALAAAWDARNAGGGGGGGASAALSNFLASIPMGAGINDAYIRKSLGPLISGYGNLVNAESAMQREGEATKRALNVEGMRGRQAAALEGQRGQQAQGLESLRQAGALNLESQRRAGQLENTQAQIEAMAPLRQAQEYLTGQQAEDVGKKRALAETALKQKSSDASIRALVGAFLDPMKRSQMSPELQQTAAQFLQQAQGYADGGQVGYGQTPSMQSLDPMMREYGQYVATSVQHGLQPVPLGKFMDLLNTGRQMLHTYPTSAQTPGFAGGGFVDWLMSVTPRSSPAPQQAVQPQPQTQPPVKPQPSTLGTGMAAGAGQQMLDRRAMEQRIMQQDQYADGGAIPVAGRQVLGAGGPTTDSIPAVIDGQRPAALSTGEYVIPADVVKAKGTEFFDKLIGRYKQDGTDGQGRTASAV